VYNQGEKKTLVLGEDGEVTTLVGVIEPPSGEKLEKKPADTKHTLIIIAAVLIVVVICIGLSYLAASSLISDIRNLIPF
jgi:hypothetical protein